MIGLIVNLAIVPPLALGPARERVATLTGDTAAALDRLADALVHPQNAATLDDLLARARALRGSVAAAEAAAAAQATVPAGAAFTASTARCGSG